MAALLEFRAEERVCGHEAETAECQHQEYEIEHLALRPSSGREDALEPRKGAIGNGEAGNKEDIKIARGRIVPKLLNPAALPAADPSAGPQSPRREKPYDTVSRAP
jgi:hypothetical protein